MADAFLKLPAEGRYDALALASDRTGREPHILEKDVWVVWALAALYGSAFGEHLVFKGGTSLSKCHGLIRRFSEDVDVTYDIRAIAPDLVGSEGAAVPETRSQEKRWTKAIRARLDEWVADEAEPAVARAIAADGLPARTRIDGHRLFVDYEAAHAHPNYLDPHVMLEFGARSTGEPAKPCDVACDAADALEGLAFPVARPRVMVAERTFWEKAMATHVFCLKQRLRSERFSRHWHDLARLDHAGVADAAIADRGLANAVAEHNRIFYREKAVDGSPVDHAAAVNGGLAIVPGGEARAALEADYADMVGAGYMMEEKVEPFDAIMDRCADIARRANGA